MRRLLRAAVLVLMAVLLFRALGVEPYRVPTGSMAPALLGDHKTVRCPRCGFPVVVGCRHDENDPQAAERCYARAFCPNCGCAALGLAHVLECVGDRLLVNKTVFDRRRPRRWEMAVFRAPADPGKIFVKRVVGLPGEAVRIRGGDVYIDGALARKTLAEFKAVRIAVVDLDYAPAPDGWAGRWLQYPAAGVSQVEGKVLRLEGAGDDAEHWLTYRNWLLDEAKEEALRDACSYNGGDQGQRLETVHDFMLECDLDVVRGSGRVALAISDGADELTAALSVGANQAGTWLLAGRKCLSTAPACCLAEGQSYHLEFALVDRRATLAIDGRCPFAPVDLPAADQRAGVTRPVKVGTTGVDAVVRHFRLFRDVHYTATGDHGVRAPVRLGPGEYFVLGDNSANSDDSRFWPAPAVPEANFQGKPFLVHWPNRSLTWDGLGRHWQYQGLDWGRVRWLH